MEETDVLDLDTVDEYEAEEEEAGLDLECGSDKPLFPAKLPYTCETLDEFQNQLAFATGKLLDCLAVGDYDVGIYRWTAYLRNLLSLKYPIPRNYRGKLARVYYEIAVMQSFDARLTELAGSMCIRLLRPKHELNRDDLVLPWRCLYEVLAQDVFSKSRRDFDTKRSSILLDVAEYAQRFFDPSEAQAMLETVLPLMDGTDLNSVIATQAILVHCLPLDGYQAWLPVMFRLWETFKSSLFDDQMLDLLARLAEHQANASLSTRTDSSTSCPWKDVGLFTDDQYALIMTKCLRSAGLPVGANKAANATLMAQSVNVRTGADALASSRTLRLKKPSDRLRSFAILMVYSMAHDAPTSSTSSHIEPHSNANRKQHQNQETREQFHMTPQKSFLAGCKALDHLAKFFQATESYFHPSNWGVWQVQLSRFVQHLTWEFARRCKEEEQEQCPIPIQRRITPLIRTEFTRSLRTVCLLSMFSKDPLTILAAQTSLKRLAYMQPELILPGVLERAFDSLEALETTHRTTSVISALAAIAQPLVQRTLYAPGAKHLVSLLHLCLPGIDLNDPMKTMSTCMFVLASCLTIPLADYTELAADQHESHQDDSSTCVVDDRNCSTIAEENDALRFSTADLPGWASGFLQRTLLLVDNLPDEGKTGKIGEKNEEMLLHSVVATWDVMCSALSPMLFSKLLQELMQYVRTTMSASGVKIIGSLVGCFARANSAAVLDEVVPMACARIATELEHGASSMRTTSTSLPREQDTALHWHISVLNGAMMFAGRNLLKHRQVLLRTCGLLTSQCVTERGYMLTAKLVQRMILSLGTLYPNEQRCVNQKVWNSAEYQANGYRYWGQLIRLQDIDVNWHTSCSEELDMVMDVVHSIATPCLDAIEELLKQENRDKIWYNDFCRHILLARYLHSALSSLHEPRKVQLSENLHESASFPSDLGTTAKEFSPQPIPLECGYAVSRTNKNYSHWIQWEDRFGDLLLESAKDLHTSGAEDQIDAAKLLVRAIRGFLLQSGYNPEELRGLAKSVTFFHTIGRTFANQQLYPRIYWVRRLALYQLSRVRLAHCFQQRTKCTDGLTIQLLQLSCSNYVAIRRLAQSTLASVCNTYDGTRAMCLEPILNTFQSSAADDRVKGALYILANRSFARFVAQNTYASRRVFLALLRIEQTKPSIQRLVRNLLSDGVQHLTEPAIRHVFLPTSCLTIAHKQLESMVEFHDRSSEETLSVVKNLRQERIQASYEQHTAFVEEVLTVASDPSTHWAYALFGLRALRALLRRDAPVDARLASFFAKESISVNPAMRKHAQSALSRVLYWIKLRTLANDDQQLFFEQVEHPLKRHAKISLAVSEETKSAQLAAFAQPMQPSSRLYDKQMGALAWLATGTDDVYYVPPAYDTPAVKYDGDSAQAIEAIRDTLKESWWNTFSMHLSQEIDRDYMSSETTAFLKTLFQILGAELLGVVMPLITDMIHDRDRHKHRAAAEMIGGAIRGAKHWPSIDQKRLWDWCDSWMPKVLTECTPDSQPSWLMCVEYIFKNRDPRRAQSLLVFVMKHAKSVLESSQKGPLEQAHAQHLLTGAVRSLQCKIQAYHTDSLRVLYFEHFGHDYHEVRRAVGEALVELDMANTLPSYPSVDALLEASYNQTGTLLERQPSITSRCETLSKQLQASRESRVPSAEGTSLYDRTAMTSTVWISMNLDDHRLGPIGTEVVTLLPDVFSMGQLRDNSELVRTAKAVLIKMASYPLSITQVAPFLRELLAMIRNATESWHARLDALPLLQVVYFQNLFYWTSDLVEEVIQLLLSLLADPHLEVREMAATTLSGIVRCSQRSLVPALRARFAAEAKAIILPKRGTANWDTQVLALHAALLGATALVAAYPYEVPEWMPSWILDVIAPHSDSPVPISKTVRNCAADFRRTHLDTWPEDQRVFGDRVQEIRDFTVGRSDYFV
ncbi:Proteasome activator BLM10 [Malassezia yamatoensis]|uniref:Proteasome activator BLM10 n=1 Tax=Malassezia yamatoensis TaxID=253288 RepID=A0AAJ6CKV6_9BASI|nr:Proteasome activator BLM10 [Malassezia yamatoensis]